MSNLDYSIEHQEDNGDPLGINDSLKHAISENGLAVEDQLYMVPPRLGVAVRLNKGKTIRIINPTGTQVCDTWFFNSNNLNEFSSMEHTRAFIDKITPRPDDVLVTNQRRPIVKMITDTSPGVHDTMIAACDLFRYKNLGIEQYHDNCADNMRLALQAIGLRAKEVPQPLNLWMNTPINPDYSISWLPAVSKSGDYVEFTAELDCIVVMSACPQDIIPINSLKPESINFIIRS